MAVGRELEGFEGFEWHQRRREIRMDLVLDDKTPVEEMDEYHDEKRRRRRRRRKMVCEGREGVCGEVAVCLMRRGIVGKHKDVSVTQNPRCFRIRNIILILSP